MSAVLVDVEQLAERVAARVVEMLVERDQAPAVGLVDAAELARLLGVSRAAIYEHAAELGAVKIGDGARPRLRFDVVQARAVWARRGSTSDESRPTEAPAPSPARRRRRRDGSGSDARLLPVKAK